MGWALLGALVAVVAAWVVDHLFSLKKELSALIKNYSRLLTLLDKKGIIGTGELDKITNADVLSYLTRQMQDLGE